MKYIVVEVQHMADGTMATPAYSYDDERSANAKYHQILSVAAVSELPVHSAVMFTENGVFIKGEDFVTGVEDLGEQSEDR